MIETTLFAKTMVILCSQLSIVFGLTFYVMKKSKEAYFNNTTFLGISFRGAMNLKQEFDLIIVAGGITTSAEQNEGLLEFLVNSKARGTIVASICTGAFILAEAGLLGKNRVTTHWEDQKELQDRFPSLAVIPNQRWVESEGIFTSGGISAGMDLSLHLVEVLSDRALALRTAKQMEYNWNQ